MVPTEDFVSYINEWSRSVILQPPSAVASIHPGGKCVKLTMVPTKIKIEVLPETSFKLPRISV